MGKWDVEAGFPLGCRGRGFVFRAGEGSGRPWTGSWGSGLCCRQGQGLWVPLVSHHGSGGHLEPSAAAASTLPSQWHLLSFSPPFSLYFCRHCISTAAKIHLLRHILPGVRKSCRFTASTLGWARAVGVKRFLYAYALPFLFFWITLFYLVSYLQKNKGFESIEC